MGVSGIRVGLRSCRRVNYVGVIVVGCGVMVMVGGWGGGVVMGLWGVFLLLIGIARIWVKLYLFMTKSATQQYSSMPK